MVDSERLDVERIPLLAHLRIMMEVGLRSARQ